MGTWGPGNLDDDSAMEEVSRRSHQLLTELLEQIRKPSSQHADEYEHGKLFVAFEFFFALDAKKLIARGAFPTAHEVDLLAKKYLLGWEAYLAKNLEPSTGFLKKRRRVIEQTFDHFKKICVRLGND